MAVEILVYVRVSVVKVTQVVDGHSIAALAQIFDLVAPDVEVEHGVPVLRLLVGLHRVDQALAVASLGRYHRLYAQEYSTTC